jgi:predicted phosphoribosyltransferase
MLFSDRRQAGRRLAELLTGSAAEGRVVLALPRGGVPVGYEIARALRCPLDVLVVRKVGAPGRPEFAVGAVADGHPPHLNHDVLRRLGIDERDLAPVVRREVREARRRASLYRNERPAVDVAGLEAIVVDDGVATGATAHVALDALRSAGPGRVVFATPVGSAEGIRLLRAEADEVVCLWVPPEFLAVGQWYREFTQLSDTDVTRLLRAAAAA